MEISFDPGRRDKTLRERQLDLLDAPEVFGGRTYDREDDRFDYGEVRFITAGYLRDSDGDRCLDQAGQCPPYNFDEEGQ